MVQAYLYEISPTKPIILTIIIKVSDLNKKLKSVESNSCSKLFITYIFAIIHFSTNLSRCNI